MSTETELQCTPLTKDEREVLHHFTRAWNQWLTLGGKHPDDDTEMRHAIHGAQLLIAARVARRVDPKIWWQPTD